MAKHGPKVRALIIHKFSRDAVPSGGGIADALGVLSSPEKLNGGMKQAEEWVMQSIQAVKDATDNPYGDDNEAIATAIMEEMPGVCSRCGRSKTSLGRYGMKCLTCERP